MFADLFVNAVFASNDGDAFLMLVGIIGILLILSVVWTFKKVPAMYWAGLVSLNVQALLFCFQFEKVVHMAQQWNNPKQENVDQQELDTAKTTPEKQWTPGQQIAIVVAVAPFFLPLIAATFVALIAANAFVGVAAFTGFSLLQILILGKVTEQDKVLEGIKPLARAAIPTIGFIINLIKALHEAKGSASSLP